MTGQSPEKDVYVVTTPRGFTETFNAHQIDVLVRLGLIRHERDSHVLETGDGRGVGPVHHFYCMADRVISPVVTAPTCARCGSVLSLRGSCVVCCIPPGESA